MEILKLSLSHYGHYIHKETSSLKMCALQYFLTTDINCFSDYISNYVEWAQNNAELMAMAGILTHLDKEDDCILITHSRKKLKKEPIEFKIQQQAFINLLHDWQTKVCKQKPEEIIIKYENNQFTIETNK